MKMKTKFFFIYCFAFMIGFFISIELTDLTHNIKKDDFVNWVDKGENITKKMKFKEYSSGLYLSDKTITDTDTSLINTPKLAGEIAVAIMEDVFDSTIVSENYPFEIYKDIFSWDIQGLCLKGQKDNNIIYLDLSKEIGINRKDGMVTFLSH